MLYREVRVVFSSTQEYVRGQDILAAQKGGDHRGSQGLAVTDQTSSKAGREGVEHRQGVVQQEVIVDHGTGLQLCHVFGGSSESEGADLHAQ